MPLNLIYGPFNSGRTGQMITRILAAENDLPLVVTPTSAARSAIEIELCEKNGGALLGIAVTSFEGLAREILAAAAETAPQLVTASQAQHLIRGTIAEIRLGILARSAASDGFSVALSRLFTDLRQGLVDPRADSGEDPYLGELLRLYAGYVDRLDARGLVDRSALLAHATRSLKDASRPDFTQPVFFYGFDDLAKDQLQLVSALAQSAPVTISLTFEDRQALRARSRLLAELSDLEIDDRQVTVPDSANTDSPVLFHLERNFGDPDPPVIAADHSLCRLESSGSRGESDLIAEQVKQLLIEGVRPSEIAVALRDPPGEGPDLADALKRAGAPVALVADLPLHRTATGTALLRLLDLARGNQDGSALLSYLRGPGPDGRGALVDRLEKEMRRRRIGTVTAALELWRKLNGTGPAELEGLLDPSSSAEARAEIIDASAAQLAEWAGDGAQETAASVAIRNTVRELSELGQAALTSEALHEALARLRLPCWSGPAGERVRIASPYDLYTIRSGRFRHVFVAALQEGSFPRTQPEGPFLSADQRQELGMPPRADNDDEEMYLFQTCLALPTERLWLSHRIADDEGKVALPSPFLERVAEMIHTSEDQPRSAPLIRRDLADVTYSPQLAPSVDEFARSLALAGSEATVGGPAEDPAASELAHNLNRRLDRAERAARHAANVRPLSHPRLLTALSEREDFAASELEAFAADPAQWFVKYELHPLPLGPDPENIVDGNIVHRALELLYSERPGGSARPEAHNLALWQERLARLIEEVAARSGRGGHDPADRVAIRRLERHLSRFLSEESTLECDLEPRFFEAGFGSRETSDQPPLRFGSWALSGKIDRVDLSPAGNQGLVQDYKFSTKVTAQARFSREGLLQLPLYALALRELWKIEPIGGIYHPLRATDYRPRGMLLADEDCAELIDALPSTSTDLLQADEFEALLQASAAQADQAVAGIRAGMIDRDPLEDAWSSSAAVQAIHRRQTIGESGLAGDSDPAVGVEP